MPNKMEQGGNVLLAPNGKPSNLTPEQYKLVRTPEFKAWFGDWENDPANASKVVDENGEPLVVYHGTKDKFFVFDLTKVGTKTDTGMWGSGFYFSSNKNYAETYSKKAYDYNTGKVLSNVGYIYDVFLCLKNPYFIKNQNDIPKIEISANSIEELQNSDKIYSDKMRQTLIEQGYDGVFVNFEFNFRGGKDFELVAFEPNQIKLADGSNTTFDASNPDIRYAGGGKVVTYKNKFNRKYGFDDNENHSLEEISKLTKLKLSALQEIYNKGIGAYKTNPESVRPNVKSKEQWAMARVYSAVMGGRASVIDKNELKRGKMEQGGNANSEKSALEQILEQVRPYQEKVVENAVENARKKGEQIKQKDIELLKLVLIADLYKAIGNYIENSDKVKDLTYNLSNNSIEVSCVIERDGTDYAFKTEVILAGGYNIQALHLRYIVKTKLPRKSSNPDFEAIKIKLSNLKKEDALLEQIAKLEEQKNIYESRIPQGSEKYLKMSDAEIEKISRADKDNELDWAYFDSTYQEHKERHPESYSSEEGFLFYQNTRRADHIERFRNNLSHRSDRVAVKNYEKEIEKLKGKLAKIQENKMADGGGVKATTSRFRPSETITFDPPLVGENGNKLVSYTWAYEYTMLPNYEGELVGKRVSDWTQADESAETGRGIVHKYGIEFPDGTTKVVSSESVPILLGFQDTAQAKVFGSLAMASKTLAKQEMKLAILEAQQKEFNEAKKSIIDKGFPAPEVREVESSFAKMRLFVGDGSCVIDDDGKYDKERLECAQGNYVKNRLTELGFDVYGSNKSYQIGELKKLVERQKRKIEQMINRDKMEQGGELEKGIKTEREHIKTLNELYAKKITPKVALKHIAMEHIAENPRYYSLLQGMKFEEGGNVTEAELMEMAKKFVNDLTPEQKAEITQKFQDVLKDELVSARKHLAYLDDTFKQNEKRIKELRELSHNNYSREIYQEEEKLSIENSTIKLKITHAMNVVKVYQEGKFLINVTDERGVEHVGIPDFRDIDTSKIMFDEETILDEPMPPYVPFIKQSTFESKGFVFDAIRISKDTYIMAVNGYEENKSRSGYEHPSADEQGYVVVTLDQLVLINDYYFTYKRGENLKKAKDNTAYQERHYDSLPAERRAQYLNQRGFYHSLPVSVKKKISQADYEALDLAGKEALYKPFKRYNPKRIVSKLGENTMWVSFHSMYERFINPEAMPYHKTTGEKVPITGKRIGLYGDKEVFAYWHDFADMMKWKLKDIKVARETESEIRKLALETSFGFSNTNDTLEAKYGILVKRQDGSKILPNQIEQIREAWVNIQSKFGGLSTLAKEVKLKISHTGDKFVFSSKASGVYVPKMGTIAVTNKWGADSFQTIFAHETAHFIDNKIGEQKGQRYFSDNFEGKAGVIARTFRNLMNQKSESDYTNCTKECFARALEQFFAIENFGYGVKLANLGTYVTERDYVSKDNYDNQLRPLIVDFLQSEKDFFKYLVEIEEPQPTNIESGEQPIEPVAETKEEIKADEKAIDELQKEPLQETQKEAEQIKESEASPSVEIPIETKTQPIEQTMENKEEKGQETKPISSTNINNWNVVPSVWKNSKTIKKVTFVNSPYDKSLQTLIKPFLGTDTLRDQFMGINFDQYGITGTNAHILAHIPMPNKEFNGAYLTAVKGAKGDMFEGRYPDYLAVIPKDTQESYPFNAYKLLQYLNVARKFANNTQAVALKISKDFNVGFNAYFLAEILEFMLKLGHENLFIHASTPSRAFIISPDKKFSAENSLYGLIMPVMIDGYELGARDLDFNKELSVYFDFSKNAVINKDGSVAPFKMEYDNNALLPDNIIEVLTKYAKWGKTSKNVLPILGNFAVENGMGRVSDLESFYFFPAPNLADGIYAIKDKAVQLQLDYKDIEDYPYFKESSAESLFAINSDALAFYVEKTTKFEGNDELRPQFSGTHFDYILGSEFNLVATDQHAISIFNIANFVTIKKDTNPFNFTIPTKTLLTFLDSLSAGEPIIVKKDNQRVIFEATTSKFSIRIIDATYPDYKSIIPKSSPIEMDIDSLQLRECLKSKEVESYIKENKKEGKIALFDKVGEINGTKRTLYLGLNRSGRREVETENVKRVCSVEIKEQEKEFETPYNMVMIMPIMVNDADKFSFGVEYLKLAIDTIPVENLRLGYRSKVAGIVIDASKVSFATTNLAKENVSKLPPAEAKPKVTPTPAPEPKKVSLEEYERLVTDELISLLNISNSDAQSILEVGNARLVVLRGYKDKESPLSIAKKVDALSKEPAPTETKKEPTPAPAPKVETKAEETKAEETEKPKLEVLKARLNLLKKMIKAQPNNTILKTRIKIVSKMIEK